MGHNNMNHRVSLSIFVLILSNARGGYKPCCSHLIDFFNARNSGHFNPRQFDEVFDGQNYAALKDSPDTQDEDFPMNDYINAKQIPKSSILGNFMKKDPEFNFERRLLKRSNLDKIYENAITRLLKRSNPNNVYEKAVLGLLKRSSDSVYDSAITRSL